MSTPPAVPARLTGTWEEFREDLGVALTVWRKLPWLPVVSAIVGGWDAAGRPPTVDPATQPPPSGEQVALVLAGAVVVFGLVVFGVGWAGAQRLIYARAWAGFPTSFSEAFSSSWRFFGRFLALAFLVVIPLLIASLVLAIPLGSVAASAITTLAAMMILTFVAPILVFDEDRAIPALKRGWRMLWAQGRAAAWYAVVGPAALVVVSVVLAQAGPLRWISSFVTGLGALAVTGATTAAYLRLTRPEGIHAPPPPVY